MTYRASRKQARRFWGSMGAATRLSSRRPDRCNQMLTGSVMRRDDGLREIKFDPYLAR
jgi:hypothetical protein